MVTFFWLSLMFTACGSAGETVIVNPSVGLNSLTQNEVRLYFTMRLHQWPDGDRVQVFVLPDNDPLHERVVKGILGLYPYQLRRAWDRQLFSGTGQVPVTVATVTELIERVARTPGAIGYSDSEMLDPSVRALRVR